MSVAAVSANDTGSTQTSPPCCISMLYSSFEAGRNFRHPSGRWRGSLTLTTNDRRLTRNAWTVIPSCELDATVGAMLPDSCTQYDFPSISYTDNGKMLHTFHMYSIHNSTSIFSIILAAQTTYFKITLFHLCYNMLRKNFNMCSKPRDSLRKYISTILYNTHKQCIHYPSMSILGLNLAAHTTHFKSILFWIN